MSVRVRVPPPALLRNNIMKSELRDCGDCILCCTIMKVYELNKPEGIKCKHCKYGCEIYNDRPMSCRIFHCLWRFRKLFIDKKNRKRPDRLGVLIIPKKEINGYSPALQFNALDRKVFDKDDVKSLIEVYRKEGFNVALVLSGSKNNILLRSKK